MIDQYDLFSELLKSWIQEKTPGEPDQKQDEDEFEEIEIEEVLENS